MKKVAHTIAIVANGAIRDFDATVKMIRDYAMVVAVDGGLNHCHKMNIRPDIIIGDCDSASPELLEKYSNIPVRQFLTDKNETDLELAIQAVYNPEVEKITVFGAQEIRADHLLANLHLLRRYPEKVFLENEFETIFAFTGEIHLSNVKGQTISLIQIGDPVQGISSKGLQWELHEASFSKYFFSLSNVCISDSVQMSIIEGDLLCILQKA